MSPDLIMITRTITVAPSLHPLQTTDHTHTLPSHFPSHSTTPACCINVYLSPGFILFLYSPSHIICGVHVKIDTEIIICDLYELLK